MALHRAAYLLYTHRQRLARRGVLVVGPNPTFLRYIEQVLPSLGETDVLLSTVGNLFLGRDRDRPGAGQRWPPSRATSAWSSCWPRPSPTASGSREADIVVEVGGQRLRLDPATGERARDQARATGEPHNQARATFRREVVAALTDQMVAALTRDLPQVELPTDDDLLADLFPDERLLDPDLDEIRAELSSAPAVRSAVDRLWPKPTAQRLVGGPFASPSAWPRPGLVRGGRAGPAGAPGRRRRRPG